MNKDELTEEKIEHHLIDLQFPGEDEESIREYLREANIPEKVINKILALEGRRHKMRVWGVIAGFGLFFLILLSANTYLVQFLEFLRSAITVFLMAGVGAIFLVGLIGILMNLNYKKVERFLKDQGNKAEDFFHRMFHP